jgi:hypothetical protein
VIPLNVAFALSLAFTVIHAAEEWFGKGGPLWDNFGRIVGVRLPPVLGFLLFIVGLAASLAALSYLGYLAGSVLAISLLLGARLGDSLFSHWGLYVLGLSNPNPGIKSTVLYVIESGIFIWMYTSSLSAFGLLGAAFFAAVLPSLWLTKFL